MKPDCLNDQELTLLHYGEASDQLAATAAGHLVGCTDCRSRQTRLASALARLPKASEVDPMAVTRLTARVGERLQKRHRWLPAAGAILAGTAALAIALVVWQPADAPQQVAVTPPQPVKIQRTAAMQATLDLDLLDKLDLLQELETLQAIEGV